MRARRSTAALIALLALALGACGSSSKPLSKAALIAKADAICRAANVSIGNVKVPTKSEQLPSFLTSLRSLAQDTADKLGALKAPAALKKSFEAYRTAQAQTAVVAGQMLESIKRKEATKFDAARVRLDTLTTQARTAALSIGFQVCASTA